MTRERFNRTLAVYQVLPGPEATELCCYFGMIARGRRGAVLAGLGVVLPGFALMFLLSCVYVRYGITSSLALAVFAGFQPAVAALIVRAVQRIGRHALTNRWLWGIAAATALTQLLDAPFPLTLAAAGFVYVLVTRRRPVLAVLLGAVVLVGVVGWTLWEAGRDEAASAAGVEASAPRDPSLGRLALSGLRAGLLTFGGAYTSIPFLQHDAVERGGWMTNEQFLDGLALGGILPAPLIIFGTFVGYLGGGAAGALVMTLGIFLPAFAFTLVGHDLLERAVENPTLHGFLDGVTAGVVGLIAAVTLGLLRAALDDPLAVAIFVAALLVLARWSGKLSIPAVMAGAGAIGLVFLR